MEWTWAALASWSQLMPEALVQAGLVLAGRYELVKLLRAGGMGEVWSGVDQHLSRSVAVKVLRPELAGPELARRFRWEAKITARLQHPGITVVHDVGSHDGEWFIVMELLKGRDLAAVLAKAPNGLPVETAMSLAAQAAEALQAAHTARVIHRDLKPANLFLLENGQLKICDFGIARAVDATPLTHAGVVVGTPPYMSPEQCEGSPVGEASDLYSLGCVLYELLTGRPPFTGDDPPTLMLQHRNVVPAGPRTICPEVPAELDRLVLNLLAKKPADRPPSAGHVAATLAGLGRPDPEVPLDQAHPRTQIVSPVVPSAEARIGRLLAEAERAARYVPEGGSKVRALCEVAGALAGTAPDRAVNLANHAERVARSISDERQLADALCVVAATLADRDPDRAVVLAEEAARLGHDGTSAARAKALSSLALALASTDPSRAERIARSSTSAFHQAEALSSLALALAATDPGRAERVALSIPAEGARAQALCGLARQLTRTDPDRAGRLLGDAERLARSLANDRTQASALGDVASALAGIEIDAAAQVAWSIPVNDMKALALGELARVLISTDPGRAASLLEDAIASALSITAELARSKALCGVATILAATDPGRARQLLHEAERSATSRGGGVYQARALAAITEAWASVEAGSAERVARLITDEQAVIKAQALCAAAQALARIEPNRAERVLDDAERLTWSVAGQAARTSALVTLARALPPGAGDRTA
jgi:hypothetical protein